jgi:hypothetical protein
MQSCMGRIGCMTRLCAHFASSICHTCADANRRVELDELFQDEHPIQGTIGWDEILMQAPRRFGLVWHPEIIVLGPQGEMGIRGEMGLDAIVMEEVD